MAKQRRKKKRPSRSRLVRKHDGTPVPPGGTITLPLIPKQETVTQQKGHRHRPTISACMIVKDEEEYLPRCLDSIRDLVDEIVVVDTGSTDNTVRIAESFGARVYYHEWENDFSKARNISIGYATGDWIFIIDADEELVREDIPLLQRELYETDYRAIILSVHNYSPRHREYTSYLTSIRLFRRETGGHYEGIVHNVLILPEDEGALRINARLLHYGYGLAEEKMARKIERSSALLLRQLEDNPDDGFAHFNFAQLMRGQEEKPSPEMMDRVIYHARRAVELTDPNVPTQRHIHLMAIHQLVTSHFNKGEYDEAERWCQKALAQRPDYLDGLLSLGHIYSSTNRLDSARKCYFKYLDLQKDYNDSEDADFMIYLYVHSRYNAFFGLGLVAEKEGDYHEAIKWYEKCAQEREDHLDLQYRWGVAHYRLGEYAEARQHWEKQIEFNPEHGGSHVFVAEVLHREGNVEDAERHLLRALELGDEFSIANYRLAIIERDRRDLLKALEYIIRMLAYDPNFADGYHLRGDIHFDLGDYEHAAEDYQWCLEVAPGDSALWNDLGNCRFRLNDLIFAEQLYRKAVEIDPDLGEARRNRGKVLAQLNRIGDACVVLAEYVETHEDDIEVIGFLGDLYCRVENVPQAMSCYEAVVAAEPSRAETWLRLADCYHNQGHIDAALCGYEKVLQLCPGHEPTLERLQMIREDMIRLKTRGVPNTEVRNESVRAT